MNGFDVTMLEGDGGQRGFRIVKDSHPLPTAGLELLIARSRQPRVVKSTDPGATVASVVAKAIGRVQGIGLSAASKSSSGTTFTQVFKGLRAQGRHDARGSNGSARAA